MSHDDARTRQILKIIKQFPCIRGWNVGKVLGVGTVGTVVCACNKEKKKKKKCAALKVQVLRNKAEMKSYMTEIYNQKKFGEFAPKVYGDCTIQSDGVTYGVIIMELLEVELDKFLEKKRSLDVMQKIGRRITEMIRFMWSKKLTHGDTALFNLAFTKRGKLVMLDFDRASTEVYRPEVDTLRLQIETVRSTQSKNTKVIHKDNLRFLKNFTGKWHAAAETRPVPGASEADEAWVNAYEEYCKEAGIKCLD